MKHICRAWILISLTAIGVTELGGQSTATLRRSSYQPLEIAQTSGSINQRVLEVVLPESATVRLNAGGSYTGELTDFEGTQLTLSANGFSQAVSLDQIREVEFFGNVWILNLDGRRISRPIRGLAIPIEGVAVDAFSLSRTPSGASLDLTGTLNDEEFERLSRDSDKVHAVTRIEFESPDIMHVTVKAVRR